MTKKYGLVQANQDSTDLKNVQFETVPINFLIPSSETLS